MKRKRNSCPEPSAWRDFLYNTNDIIITIIILAIALLVIAWRVDVIMAYPRNMNTTKTQTTSQVQKSDKKVDSNSADSHKSKAAAKNDSDKKSDTASDKKGSAKKSDKAAAKTAEYVNGRLTKTVKITIEQGSLTGAIDQLKDAGLYDTRHEYRLYCKQQGIDPGKIKAGKHTLKKGWTKDKIARVLTK